MSAGKLRDRVTFQRNTTGADQYGNVVDGWEDILTVWGDVLERLGGEKIRAGVPQAEHMATIRVRKSLDAVTVTEADRISARGQTWNIRSIAEVGRKGELLEILCEAGVAT